MARLRYLPASGMSSSTDHMSPIELSTQWPPSTLELIRVLFGKDERSTAKPAVDSVTMPL